MSKIFSIILSSFFLFSCSPEFHRIARKPPRIDSFHFMHFDGILTIIIKILIIAVLILLIKNLYDKNKKDKKE